MLYFRYNIIYLVLWQTVKWECRGSNPSSPTKELSTLEQVVNHDTFKMEGIRLTLQGRIKDPDHPRKRLIILHPLAQGTGFKLIQIDQAKSKSQLIKGESLLPKVNQFFFF